MYPTIELFFIILTIYLLYFSYVELEYILKIHLLTYQYLHFKIEYVMKDVCPSSPNTSSRKHQYSEIVCSEFWIWLFLIFFSYLFWKIFEACIYSKHNGEVIEWRAGLKFKKRLKILCSLQFNHLSAYLSPYFKNTSCIKNLICKKTCQRTEMKLKLS